ncbi:MFS transporter [Paramyrothecium foliicola]|nr:MFS transporter [Paramyrothecium foliicola]
MAPRDDDLDDAATEVGSNGDAYVAAERTPLLPTDLPAQVVPDKSFQHLVMAMTLLFLFIVEVATYLMDPPIQSVMEDIICRQKFPDHVMFPVSHAADARCKGKEVQKTLAMVKGWIFSSEMFVPLLVQIPYGILADRIGRRPVLFLSLLGCTLQTMWKMMILYFSNIFPVWAVTLGSLGFLVGGGGQMAGAMLWTIVADVTPAAERTRAFYLLSACIIALSVIIKPLSAFIMNLDPWIDMLIGLIALVIGTLVTLLIPETLALRREADAKRLADENSNDGQAPTAEEPLLGVGKDDSVLRMAWNTTRDAAVHMWHFIFASKSIMWLLSCYVVAFPVDQAFTTYLLQYMTKRYDWSWSKATYVSNVHNVTALIVLLGLLPLASGLLTSRFGFGPLSRDLFLARASVVFIALSAALMAFAFDPWIMVVSLITYGFGTGFPAICRGLLNGIVEPHTVATLNTVISVFESVMGLWAVPAVGWLLGRGVEMGGVAVGLPYMVVFGCTVAMGIGLFLWRLPKGLES